MAWNPVIGLPNPNTFFGWEIDRATPDWPASWLTPTTTPTAGYYYVDKTAPGATNTANTYGHPDLPRLTPPEGLLSAGDFVYIHAGTYTAAESGGDRWNWHGVGTSENPIWITGNPAIHPTFSDLCQIGETGSAAYFVFENFNSTGGRGLSILPQIDGDTIDHVLIRNCIMTGTGDVSDGDGIAISRSSSSDTIPNSTVTDVVVYNCTLSAFGNTASSDEGGVYLGYHTNRVWVLDCDISAIGGDGIAGSHYSNYTDKTAQNYYIGRNHVYECGENSIDLKTIDGFVISENDCHGPYVREGGAAIVLHYGANPIPCRNGAVIFNRIHLAASGVFMGTSDGCDDLFIAVGNLFYDIKDIYGPSPEALNASIQIGGSDGTFLIADNTFFNCDRGIRLGGLDGADTVKLHGNIHSDITGYSLITVNGQEGFVTTNYGLYEGTPTFFWANASRTLAYMQATALQEANAVSGDPLFIDSGSGNFGLDTGSPAIGVSVEGPVGDSAYTAFQTMFGESILFDFDGIPRPASGAWDMGALEYVADTYTLNITTLNATTLTVG